MKIGDKNTIYNIVVPYTADFNDGWLQVSDDAGELCQYDSLEEAIEATDDLLETHGGSKLFILKETYEIVETLLIPKVPTE